jgi:hypothetical protein
MYNEVELKEEYDKLNQIYAFARSMIFMAGIVLFLDYFIVKLSTAEGKYLPSWFKLIAGAFMLVLGMVVNTMPKPIFAIATICFFFFSGIWALLYVSFLELGINKIYNMGNFLTACLAILKFLLFMFFYNHWIKGYKTINRMADIKKKISQPVMN